MKKLYVSYTIITVTIYHTCIMLKIYSSPLLHEPKETFGYSKGPTPAYKMMLPLYIVVDHV